jgi:hypothetical protein
VQFLVSFNFAHNLLQFRVLTEWYVENVRHLSQLPQALVIFCGDLKLNQPNAPIKLTICLISAFIKGKG